MRIKKHSASIQSKLPALTALSLIIITISAGSAFAQIGNPSGGTTNVVIDTTAINDATCWLLYYTEGMYGALLVAVSGIGALVASAVGMHRSALNCLVVAVGAFLIHPTAEMFFGDKSTPVIDCTNVFSNGPTLPNGLPSVGNIIP